MKRRLLLAWILLLITNQLVYSQENEFLEIGGAQNDCGYSICLDQAGNILLAGVARSYGAGSDDFFLVKMDQNFSIVFQKSFGWQHHDRAKTIIATRDGGYALFGEVWDGGYGREDMYLLKLNQQGDKSWDGFYGGDHTDQGFDVIEIEDGFIGLGYTASFGGSTRGNFLLVRCDKNGNLVWQKDYGTSYLDYGFSVIEAEPDGYWLVGSAGGFYNLARADFHNPDSDLLLIRVDENGEEILRKQIGGQSHDWGRDMIRTENALYITGSTQSMGQGSFDLYLVCLEHTGEIRWEKNFGGLDFEYGEAIQLAADESLYICGTTASGTQDHHPDMYLLKVDQSGELIWEQRIGTLGSDYAYDLLTLPDSGCLVLGSVSHPVGNTSNLALIRVDKNGEIMNINQGVDFLPTPEISIYPNPAQDEVSIDWDGFTPGEEILLSLYDAAGRLIQTMDISHISAQKIQLQQPPRGLLFYRIFSDHHLFSGKIIIQ